MASLANDLNENAAPSKLVDSIKEISENDKKEIKSDSTKDKTHELNTGICEGNTAKDLKHLSQTCNLLEINSNNISNRNLCGFFKTIKDKEQKLKQAEVSFQNMLQESKQYLIKIPVIKIGERLNSSHNISCLTNCPNSPNRPTKKTMKFNTEQKYNKIKPTENNQAGDNKLMQEEADALHEYPCRVEDIQLNPSILQSNAPNNDLLVSARTEELFKNYTSKQQIKQKKINYQLEISFKSLLRYQHCQDFTGEFKRALVITKDNFRKIVLKISKTRSNSIQKQKQTLDILFDNIQGGRKGALKSEELLIGVAAFAKGSFEEKIKLSFLCFGCKITQNPEITYKNLLVLLRSLFAVLLHSIPSSAKCNANELSELTAKQCFSECEIDLKDKIDANTFMNWVSAQGKSLNPEKDDQCKPLLDQNNKISKVQDFQYVDQKNCPNKPKATSKGCMRISSGRNKSTTNTKPKSNINTKSKENK